MPTTLPTKALIEAYNSPEGEPTPTGYTWLDKPLHGGLKRKQLLVVGALDNVGKSRVCLGMVVRRALLGKHTLYISVEDGEEEVGRRLSKVLHGLPESEQGLVHLYTHYSFPLPEPHSVADAIMAAPSDISLFIVDYIQALSEEENNALKSALRCVFQAATHANAGLVVASQLTERYDLSGQLLKPPTRRWLRGSRSMSNMSHAVVVLWKEQGAVLARLDKNKAGDVDIQVTLPTEYGGAILGDGKDGEIDAEW